ncbi:unnamed protein product [Notodromas monacha]|uniref:EF-hand domain-containing protein n=1 Tax=Notodromas monacha TaxID=399045 RepID=A0A7R9BGM2_9CRUS|nr:unnamed protein product [Notodromas monacha]CAG0914040.1 unnamed protein product [Notodromas monacha]
MKVIPRSLRAIHSLENSVTYIFSLQNFYSKFLSVQCVCVYLFNSTFFCLNIMSTLGAEKVAELTRAFKSYDKDGKGTIVAADLGPVLKSLGYDPTTDEIAEILQRLQLDADGEIRLQDFISYASDRSVTEITGSDAEIKAVFRLFDKDGDGFITASEFSQVMTQLGESIPESDIQDMIAEADTDGDNRMSYEEFQRVVVAASINT